MGINTISNTITLLGRIFDTQKVRKPILPDPFSKPACRTLPIHQPFSRVRPEEVGLDSGRIAAFLKELGEDETLNMHSLLILKDGKLVTEAVFGEHDLRIWKQTFSACKSITSLAIGIAVGEGLLSPEDKLTELLDGKLPPLARLTVKEITLRHLLTMTTGASFNEAAMLTEKDWVKEYLNGSFSPGEFAYNSLNSYILSVILQEKAGQSLTEYLRPRLFLPLGIDEYYWECCPQGYEKGGWGLYMRPEDLAKIGVLVMNGGIWNVRQLVPKEWIDEATRTQVSASQLSEQFDYGYHFWTGRHRNTFLFNGMLGQNVLGFRESGIILVSNAGNEEIFQSSNYFTAADRFFGGKHEDVLPPNDAAYKILQKTLYRLREHLPPVKKEKTNPIRRLFTKQNEKPAPQPLPPECDRLNGVRFETDDPHAPSVSLMPLILQVVQNNYGDGLQSISFLRSGNGFYMTYTQKNESFLLPIGFGVSADTDLRIGDVPYHVKTLGSFVKDEDGRPIFKIRVTFCETPVTRYIKLYYTGAAPHLKQYETPGSDLILTKLMGVKNALVLSPLIGGTLDKIDNDYLRYRVEKAFIPDIRVTREDS